MGEMSTQDWLTIAGIVASVVSTGGAVIFSHWLGSSQAKESARREAQRALAQVLFELADKFVEYAARKTPDGSEAPQDETACHLKENLIKRVGHIRHDVERLFGHQHAERYRRQWHRFYAATPVRNYIGFMSLGIFQLARLVDAWARGESADADVEGVDRDSADIVNDALRGAGGGQPA